MFASFLLMKRAPVAELVKTLKSEPARRGAQESAELRLSRQTIGAEQPLGVPWRVQMRPCIGSPPAHARRHASSSNRHARFPGMSRILRFSTFIDTRNTLDVQLNRGGMRMARHRNGGRPAADGSAGEAGASVRSRKSWRSGTCPPWRSSLGRCRPLAWARRGSRFRPSDSECITCDGGLR